MQIGNKIIVQMPRYIAVFFVNELAEMFSTNRDIWEQAIRRGKSEARFQKSEQRVGRGRE